LTHDWKGAFQSGILIILKFEPCDLIYLSGLCDDADVFPWEVGEIDQKIVHLILEEVLRFSPSTLVSI
jgi:hypothetical protein